VLLAGEGKANTLRSARREGSANFAASAIGSKHRNPRPPQHRCGMIFDPGGKDPQSGLVHGAAPSTAHFARKFRYRAGFMKVLNPCAYTVSAGSSFRTGDFNATKMKKLITHNTAMAQKAGL